MNPRELAGMEAHSPGADTLTEVARLHDSVIYEGSADSVSALHRPANHLTHPGPFAVIENLPASLPDDGPPPIFPTFEEAEAHAKELARYLTEEALDAEEDFSSIRESPTLWRITYHGFGSPPPDRVIEIFPTTEEATTDA